MIPLPIHYEELESIYSNTLGADYHSVAVTSAEHGEGVSMIAYALARRSAAAGRRTLLVDLNTASSSVVQRLGLQRAEWSSLDATAMTEIVDLEGIGMSVLSAPVDIKNILDIREDENMKHALNVWRESYDCIVLDTSPLTRSNQGNISPDLVAGCCDCTVFTVLAGRTAETKVSEAILRLKKSGANVVGSIINDRHSPSLINELCRETRRFEKRLPKLMIKLSRFFRNNAFLMQKI